MEHLLSSWPEVAEELRDARHVLLLIDYDGTLTPIVERPELAELSETAKRLLEELAHQSRFIVGIISGRALADLKDKVGISGIIYAGNHGLEIEGPGICFTNPVAEELSPVLQAMSDELSQAVSTIKGVFVENKGLTLSVHYRLAEEGRAEDVERIVRQVIGSTEAAERVKITYGKKVYEVRPDVVWDKGKALELLITRYSKEGRRSELLPVYFGDDLTDEDGFRVIKDYRSGISVFVGDESQQSSARYFLKSPAEVTTLLAMLLEQH